MFGSKDKNLLEVPKDMRVTTIPQDFYAGADPTVKFKETEKTVDMSKFAGSPLKEYEKKALDAATAKGTAFSSTKWWIIGASVLFVLFLAGAGIYYWLTLRPKTAVPVPAPPKIETPIVPVTPVVPIEPVVTTTPTTTPETPSPIGAGMELPGKLLSFSADIDNDNISDAAELVFGSDPGNPDTDGDHYPDGHELFYLYNPNGFEPKKLIDSGVVKLFKSGNFDYELYYPESWAVGSVDTEGRQVLFSTLTGENIEVRVFGKDAGQTPLDWFSANAPTDEQFGDYNDFSSRFGIDGKVRDDGLVYFFFIDTKVYAIIYHVTGSDTVNYKPIMEIMGRSFYAGLSGMPRPEMVPEYAPVPTSTTSTAGISSTEPATATSTEAAGELTEEETPEEAEEEEMPEEEGF